MVTVAEPHEKVRTATAGVPDARAGRSRPLRILALVDGSECTGRVIKYLLQQHALGVPFEVTLLNVQPQPQDWRLRGYGWFKREAIRERIIADLAQPTLAHTGRQLDGVGIAHRERIELGEASETIVRCAREENCDLIVLAEASPGAVRRWLMHSARVSIGSVANAVGTFAHVPVVVAH
jgi:nucleotide-binding universal stress UspA family protein